MFTVLVHSVQNPGEGIYLIKKNSIKIGNLICYFKIIFRATQIIKIKTTMTLLRKPTKAPVIKETETHALLYRGFKDNFFLKKNKQKDHTFFI